MKICINGDSWGEGEWQGPEDIFGLQHRGVEKYLIQDGFDVTNISEGGSSNKMSYDRLEKTLKNNEFDLIFFFQTDPLRDYRDSKFFGVFNNLESLFFHYNQALHNHYQRINSLNVPIYLIGGPDKIKQKDLQDYPYLKVFIPSVIEMVCPHLKHPEIWCSSWFNDIDSIKNRKVIEYICEQKSLQDKLWNNLDPRIKYYFYPDNRHTNRNGHYEIYKKIVINLLDLEPKRQLDALHRSLPFKNDFNK
jgi:hypothetical protein